MTNSFSKGWYAILAISEVKRKPISIERFGVNIVVWLSNQQEVIVMEDSCPHRSAKLSLGKICNGNITCPFHGFQFNKDGQCVYAPEFNKPIPGLKTKVFKVKIEVGMVWLYYGSSEEPLIIDPLITLYKDFNFSYSFTTKIWKSHITRCIENQLDYTHLSFVHSNTIGRNFHIPEKLKFIKNVNEIKVLKEENKDPFFEYIFPNAWILHISNKIKLIVYFVPIKDDKTKFYLFTYRKFLNQKFLKPVIDYIFNISNKIILKQDQKIVESQGNKPSYLANNELLMFHDTAIRIFRELWQNKL